MSTATTTTTISKPFLSMEQTMMARLNLDGVKELHRGNHRQAIGMFRKILGRLRARLMDDTKSADLRYLFQQVYEQLMEIGEIPLAESGSNSNNTTTGQQESAKQAQNMGHSGIDNAPLFAFFPRAFLLYDKEGEENGNDRSGVNNDANNMPREMCYTRELVVLLYNMGLAYHMEGMQLSRECSYCYSGHASLTAALELYELAFEIMQFSAQRIQADDITMLLALANNLGHIHAYYDHPVECDEYQGWMEQLIVLTASADKKDDEDSILDSEELEFFMASCAHAKDANCLPEDREFAAAA